MKEILSRKRKLTHFETIKLNEEYSVILQNKLPHKLQDPRSLKIPCSIGSDSRASINLMPFSIYKNLGLEHYAKNDHLQHIDGNIR